MPLLHELIAVEPELRNAAGQAVANAVRLLQGQDNFLGQTRKYHPLEDGGETYPDEVKNLRMTVSQVIEDLSKVYSNFLDVTVSKEVTNAATTATIKIDGTAVLENLPAPALLNLEARLTELRPVIEAIPVLDQTEVWEQEQDSDVWRTSERVTYKTKKVPRNHVKAEATKEHPAQVEMFYEDVRVGIYLSILSSGCVTIAQKKAIIERLDNLLLAVKTARQRANSIEASIVHPASAIFGYIFEPL